MRPLIGGAGAGGALAETVTEGGNSATAEYGLKGHGGRAWTWLLKASAYVLPLTWLFSRYAFLRACWLWRASFCWRKSPPSHRKRSPLPFQG